MARGQKRWSKDFREIIDTATPVELAESIKLGHSATNCRTERGTRHSS
ncbi:hypothetical protein E2C01_063849 [Portunus trituberculatus]|uniref:Uncharacterized protein n=1 Tax=Portunus trituberculatus TaxID=210409 RepID=A0A5B7HIS2_PORTR|nr:hypothetical protein [Portunus trituberculatus]